MNAASQSVRSKRVVVDGELRPATLSIKDGVISTVDDYDAVRPSDQQLDFGDSVIMPGLVDAHVHINEPGRTEWEGFRSATRAAAAGGVTTLIEMPLNSIPAVTSLEAFQKKVAAAKDLLTVDVGLWGGVVPGNVRELSKMYEAGVFGFKCFLVPSGVPEFEAVREFDLREAMPKLSSLGATLLVHCELPGPINDATRDVANQDPRKYSTWLASRPNRAEDEAIAMMIRLSKEFGTRVHIVHLSSASALPLLFRAKAEGVNISVETCPHYLSLVAEEISDGATAFKCAPPIRDRENQRQLWEGLQRGIIDLIASDHSPAPPAMKCADSGDFMQAWGGIASLQLTLSIIWTQAGKLGFDIPTLARWLCSAPAQLAGLQRKGKVKAGYDADLMVWNPEETFLVKPELLQHRHKLTPYSGHTLHGVVRSTFLRGQQIFSAGQFPARLTGRVLTRGRA